MPHAHVAKFEKRVYRLRQNQEEKCIVELRTPQKPRRLCPTANAPTPHTTTTDNISRARPCTKGEVSAVVEPAQRKRMRPKTIIAALLTGRDLQEAQFLPSVPSRCARLVPAITSLSAAGHVLSDTSTPARLARLLH